MSTLNLTPNPSILLIQLGLFLANLFVIKKLILQPYLELRTKREAMTKGNAGVAQKLTQEAAQKAKQIDDQLIAMRTDIATHATKLKNDTTAKARETIRNAEQEAKKFITENERVISEQVRAEETKLPELVNSTAKTLFEQAID